MSKVQKPLIFTSIAFQEGTSEKYKNEHISMMFNQNSMVANQHPELGLQIDNLIPKEVSISNYITY